MVKLKERTEKAGVGEVIRADELGRVMVGVAISEIGESRNVRFREPCPSDGRVASSLGRAMLGR